MFLGVLNEEGGEGIAEDRPEYTHIARKINGTLNDSIDYICGLVEKVTVTKIYNLTRRAPLIPEVPVEK